MANVAAMAGTNALWDLSSATGAGVDAAPDGGHRVLGEQIWGTTDDSKVVGEVCDHVIALKGLHVAAANHARGEGSRGVEKQLVNEGGLPA